MSENLSIICCNKTEAFDMWIDDSKITDWKIVKEIVVGGLEWIGFPKISA